MIKDLVDKLLKKETLPKDEMIELLKAKNEDLDYLFKKAYEVKLKYVGNKVFFRGIIEYSNICKKNCFYCGLRRDNKSINRYTMEDSEVIEAALFAYNNKFGSIVLQSGENSSPEFVKKISYLLKTIKEKTNNRLRITLSLGEQSYETYKEWFINGAHRYLLRIEVSNPILYSKLHPKDNLHDYQVRLNSLNYLKQIGYQVGTGVMIGLPFQSFSDLVDDLFFMKDFDIDMCGMGPYIEHSQTPLYNYAYLCPPLKERFYLTLKMIAILRIMMKDINIAATTALQTIEPDGREKAILVGANVIMPNITPTKYRKNYLLYENKPCIDESGELCLNCLKTRLKLINATIGFNEWGDSKHFQKKISNSI